MKEGECTKEGKKNMMGTWKEFSNFIDIYSRGRMGLLKRLVKKAFMTFLCCCPHVHFLTDDRKRINMYEESCDYDR